jgi:general secretion pathway protein A
MYAEFFGLAELPFRITADPRFLWYSDQHREAKAKILHHIQSRKGPVYLFADVGTGKTSIAKRIIDELAEDQTKKIVSMYAPNIKTSNAFLRFVMDEFGVKTDRNYAVSLKHFEQFLIDQFREGSSPVLLIDEAQNLTSDMLKLIHYLFNFATHTDFLLQVALFGQLELHDRIHRHQSLRSRMTPARLSPFTPEETKQMVEFRWQVAGGPPSAAGGKHVPFDDGAFAEMFRVTGGNPRDIVKLCDAALIRAFADGRHVVDRDTMIAAASDAFVIESTL